MVPDTVERIDQSAANEIPHLTTAGGERWGKSAQATVTRARVFFFFRPLIVPYYFIRSSSSSLSFFPFSFFHRASCRDGTFECARVVTRVGGYAIRKGTTLGVCGPEMSRARYSALGDCDGNVEKLALVANARALGV